MQIITALIVQVRKVGERHPAGIIRRQGGQKQGKGGLKWEDNSDGARLTRNLGVKKQQGGKGSDGRER